MAEGMRDQYSQNEIVNSRVINFPQRLVYKAWSAPEHLKNWWGPKGFSNTFHEFDFSVGGRWRFTMHGPEKGNYENDCEFTVITLPALIRWKRYSKPLFQVEATFEEISQGHTKVVFKQIFDTVEECNKMRPHVQDKNEENFDRLEAELVKMVL